MPKTAETGIIPPNVRWSFYLGAALLLVCILWTVFTVREKQYYSAENKDADSTIVSSTSAPKTTILTNIPKVLLKLGLVQFFSWFAFFSMWVFTTSAVAQHFFKLPVRDTSSAAFADAANLTGLLFATYNLTATVLALLLPKLYGYLGQRNTHTVALFIGAIGFISIYYMPTTTLLFFLHGLNRNFLGQRPFYALRAISQQHPVQKSRIIYRSFQLFYHAPPNCKWTDWWLADETHI